MGKPEASSGAEDNTTDGHTNPIVSQDQNKNDWQRGRVPRPSFSRINTPPLNDQLDTLDLRASKPVRDWWHTGYQMSHCDGQMPGKSTEHMNDPR